MPAPTTNAAAELQRSTALLTTGLNQLHSLITQISGQVAAVVKLYEPTAFIKFDLAARDATAALGKILTPALEKFTVLIRGVGDVFASLSPETQKLIQATVAAAVGIGVMTAAVVALDLAINTSLGGIPAILGLVAGGAAGMAFALKDLAAVQTAVQEAMRVLSVLMNAVGAAAQIVADAFRPVLASLSAVGGQRAGGQPGPAGVVESLAASVLPVIQTVASGLAAAFQALLPALRPVIDSLTTLAGTVLTQLSANFTAMLPVLVEAAQLVAGLIPHLVNVAGALFTFQSAILRAVAPGLKAFLDALSPVGAVIGTLATLVATSLSAVAGLLEGGARVVTAFLQPLLDVLSEVGGAFGELNRELAGLAPLLALAAREVGRALSEMFAAVLPLLPSLTGPLIRGLRAFADVVTMAARGIAFITAELRDLLGVAAVGLGGDLDTFRPGASQGLAVRNVQVSDVSSMITRAQTQSLAAGRPAEENYQKTSAGYLEQIRDKVDKLPENLAKSMVQAIKDSKLVKDVNAIGGITGVAPGADSAFGMAGWAARQAVRQITG